MTEQKFEFISTKDELFGLQDIELKAVEIPEWKKTVMLKSMSASERDAWEAETYALRKKGEEAAMLDFRSRFLARCICNAEGKLLLTAADVKEFGKRSALVLDRLFDIARSMNGMKQADVDKMAENLPEGQTAV